MGPRLTMIIGLENVMNDGCAFVLVMSCTRWSLMTSTDSRVWKQRKCTGKICCSAVGVKCTTMVLTTQLVVATSSG